MSRVIVELVELVEMVTVGVVSPVIVYQYTRRLAAHSMNMDMYIPVVVMSDAVVLRSP